MSAHRLLLAASGSSLSNLSQDDLLWRPPPEASSMDTSLGPRIETLGNVPALHVDFVRIAALVFFADRTVQRPRGWVRDLHLETAVSAPSTWAGIAGRLEDALFSLTGDLWTLKFSSRREPRRGTIADFPEAEQVALFSGGADSGAGALLALLDHPKTVLVSHNDWSNVRGQQNRVRGELERITGGEIINVSWRLARKQNQLGSGDAFGEEPSRRSRSIVFLALGLAVASLSEVPLLVPENGFTSLNPPLSGERRGALSTRTTHPGILDEVGDILRGIGLHADIRNPFEEMTKGEAFQEVKSRLGASAASNLLSSTNSCAKPGREQGFAPDSHCGACLGCLVRRAAFGASGLTDQTEYKEQAMERSRRATWLSSERRKTYESSRYRVAKGYQIDDILGLGLPDRWDPEDALDLARRGLNELAGVRIP